MGACGPRASCIPMEALLPAVLMPLEGMLLQGDAEGGLRDPAVQSAMQQLHYNVRTAHG